MGSEQGKDLGLIPDSPAFQAHATGVTAQQVLDPVFAALPCDC
jgi:hypothetical protein